MGNINISANNGSTTDYIQYDNLVLNDGSNEQILVNAPSECINACLNNPNCQGLNIISNVGANQVTTDGYNYQNIPPITCEYVSNICYSNAKSENPNSKFFAKKNNLLFENNTPYLLKNNGVCLSVTVDSQNNQNLILGSSDCNDSDNVTPVFFNNNNNSISVDAEGNNCLNYNNGALGLSKCNTYDSTQNFIYDHVYNTLRPSSDTTLCVNATKVGTGGNSDYIFSMDRCEKSNGPVCTFDYSRYSNYYPDLQNAFGYADNWLSDIELKQHYLTYGINEKRTPCGDIKPTCVWNASDYLIQNPDVAKAGVDPLNHYLTYGINEGRSPCPSIDYTPGTNTTFENYYKPNPKEDYIEYFDNDYSVDMRYYIIYVILLCMIIYLVIVSSSLKKK